MYILLFKTCILCIATNPCKIYHKFIFKHFLYRCLWINIENVIFGNKLLTDSFFFKSQQCYHN